MHGICSVLEVSFVVPITLKKGNDIKSVDVNNCLQNHVAIMFLRELG